MIETLGRDLRGKSSMPWGNSLGGGHRILTDEQYALITEHMLKIADTVSRKTGRMPTPPSKSDDTRAKTFFITLLKLTPEERAAEVDELVKRGNYAELSAIWCHGSGPFTVSKLKEGLSHC
jgi:hypothetical protein